MENKRRRYDRSFKIEAVRVATTAQRPFSAVAKNLGISPNMMWRWKRELSEEPGIDSGRENHSEPQSDQVRNLRRELIKVKEERDILRKAVDILSNYES